MKTNRPIGICITTTLLYLAALPVTAQDWPQWRGPNRESKATFTPPKAWPKELTAAWKLTVGDGVATPSLVGDKLYVFSRQEGAEVLRCLDAANGKELWAEKYESLGASGPASGFSGPRCSPTLAEGKVVTLGVRGALVCRDAASGKLLWRKEDFPGSLPRFFTSASPIIADGMCIAQVGGGEKGGIVAYDLATGDHKWEWTGSGAAYASPTLLVVGGAKYVVAMTDTQVVAISLASGKTAWETPFVVQGRGYNAASPLVDGQTVIYAGSGRGTTAVKLEKDGEALKATELWKNADASVMFNSPVLSKGLLYGLSARNEVFCLKATDGKTAWTAALAGPNAEGESAGGPPRDGGGVAAAGPGGGGPGRGGMGGGRGGRGGGMGYGSIVDAGTVMLALTPASQLVAFEPGEKSFTELARIKVSATPTYAYPVVSGKRMFIKDQEAVMLYVVE